MSNFWNGKRVMITGVTGLIGGYLSKMLMEEGAEATGFDIDDRGTLIWHDTVGKFPILKGDILDLDSVTMCMPNFDAVFHLAAISGVEASRSAGYGAFQVNTVGTLNVLEAARRMEPGVVVVASTNHVYGKQVTLPAKESAPLNQMDTYTVAKIAADYITRGYYHNYNVPTIAIRNTNCFGPYDPHSDHIIPGVIQSILRQEPPIIKSNGETQKSYLHTQDVALAYMMVAEAGLGGRGLGEAINVSGEPISVLGLVNAILEVAGSTLQPIVMNEPNDQSNEHMDITRLRELTNWSPRFTLSSALHDTFLWFKEQRVIENMGKIGV
jgi:CDP-glucose 4,6-dehydratase